MGCAKFFKVFSLAAQRLARGPGRKGPSGGYGVRVTPLSRADRAVAVAAAAAHDLNDELTVILSSVTDSLRGLDPGHPVRPLLLELRSAAQRCAWTASGLLNFTARRGARPSAVTLERLVAEERRAIP